MRTIGISKHSKVPSPQEAWDRGRALDTMLPQLGNQRNRGVWKLSHAAANQMDDALMSRTAALHQASMRIPNV